MIGSIARGRNGARVRSILIAVATAAGLLLWDGPAAWGQSLHEYCSGPGRDYGECMRRGQLSQSLSPGLRSYCSRRGVDFDDCVERYVNRGSFDDMTAYCSQRGRSYRQCMDELLDGRQSGSSNYYRNEYRDRGNSWRPHREHWDGSRERNRRYDYWERDSYWDLRSRN